MTLRLCAIFFLSGAAALVFETLWFHQAALAFGSSLWATSLVTAAFMGGLALGNLLVGRCGHRVARPLRAYAALELAIGVLGLALVHALPRLVPLFARALGPFVDAPALAHPLRLAFAFALLLGPATAMGAALPLVVSALARRDASFGRALGRLYGWNTLGAVAGALAGEAWLVERFGIRGSALVALGANAAAAAAALALARSEEAASAAPPRRELPPLPRAAWGVLAGAFAAGFALLGLEVVWFRIALLHLRGDSLAFATMLAVVLAGIGLGAVAGGARLGRRPDAANGAPALALALGALAVLAYARLGAPGAAGPFARAAEVALQLMFPVALGSGALFALLGAALDRLSPAETRSAGLLTLANTAGAMLGPLVAAFALLPRAGIERSLEALAGVYLLAALAPWLAGVRPRGAAPRGALAGAAAAFALAFACFPSGALRERDLRAPLAYWERAEGARPVAIREGVNETILYLERPLLGETLYHRLVTNGYSMSSTSFYARRYMKLFVWWALAVAPDARRALLVSYGVGNTARALADVPTLERIDVVDVSRDALETSRIAFPDASRWPLADPRVRVHVEDGRHFLQATRERWDWITGEPPPPKLAGVVSLYTREHFALVRDRLAEGGVATWWLPVHALLEPDAKAIVGAFCASFADCSLWRGSGYDWILAGTRGAGGPGSPERFAAPWREPAQADERAALGVERPEQLGALFIAGPETLRAFAADAPPLDDDHPRRLTLALAGPEDARRTWWPWLDPRLSRERFASSPLVSALWPAPLRGATLDWFELQGEIDRVFDGRLRDPLSELPTVHRILAGTPLRALPLWLLGSDPDEQRAVRAAAAKGASGSGIEYRLALAALAERRFDEAAERLERVVALGQARSPALELRIYALAMAGRRGEAERLAAALRGSGEADGARAGYLAFLERSFGIAAAAP